MQQAIGDRGSDDALAARANRRTRSNGSSGSRVAPYARRDGANTGRANGNGGFSCRNALAELRRI
jgi:hypothetical protein